MRCKVILFLLCVFQLLGSQPQYQQVMTHKRPHQPEITRLNPVIIRPYPVAVDSSNYKLYILTDVMYDFMQFTYGNTKYSANIQLEANLIHRKNQTVYSRIWQSSLTVNDFETTNSRSRFLLSVDSLRIPAGGYDLKMNYRDLQAEKKHLYKMKLHLPAVKSFYPSPPLFCDSSLHNDRYPQVFPKRPLPLREHLPFNRPLGMYLNIWAPDEPMVHVKLEIRKDPSSPLLFSKDTALTVNKQYASKLFYPPCPEWREGTYQFSVRYRAGPDSIMQSLKLQLLWFEKPRSLFSPDYALKPLQAVLPPDKYEKINSGNDEEKQAAFRKYWKNVDPTPSTAYNEKMAEFYERVDHVDMKWGGKRHHYGWRTDPGRVYLLYGKPDEVEDFSLDPVNPYMKWVYRLPDRTLNFTFKALDGRKRYRLIHNNETPEP